MSQAGAGFKRVEEAMTGQQIAHHPMGPAANQEPWIFFAFLRSGEFTVQASQFDASWHLTPRDISVDDLACPSLLKVH